MTGFDLFDRYVLNMLSLNVAHSGAHFDFTVFMLYGPVILSAFVLAISMFFSSLVWHLGCALSKLAGVNGAHVLLLLTWPSL